MAADPAPAGAKPGLGRRTALASLLLASMPSVVPTVVLALAPAAAEPAASAATAARAVEAKNGYRVFDLDWLDLARQRAVPVRLYLPDAAQATHPVPLIAFSHGIGGSRLGYSYLGRFWAAQGFASLHLQHSGSDRSLWRGNPFGMVGRLHSATADAEAVDRVRDLGFALDQILSSEFAASLDARQIVAAGHSYGANTTLLAAGARVERQGRAVELREPRICAAIVISAPPFYADIHIEQILGSVAVPSLHITASEDVIRVPGFYSPASDRVAVYEATGGPAKTLAVFAGGSHNIFSDRSSSGGASLNPQVKAATQALSLAFLHSVLDHDNSALAAWPARFAPLLARFASNAPGVGSVLGTSAARAGDSAARR